MEKDDGYSSGDSEIGMKSSIIFTTATIQLGDDPNAHKKDKACTVCSKSFSMMGSMKKHFCKFCFRGVCGGCSKHSAPDPSKAYNPSDSSKTTNVRICDSCYQKAIQDQVRDNLQKDLDKEKAEISEIQQKLAVENEQRKNESYRRDFLERKLQEIRIENSRKEKELIDQSEKLTKEIKNMELDIEELTKILNNAENEKKAKDDKIFSLKQEISLLKSETQGDIDKIAELRKLVEEQELENERLSNELSYHAEVSADGDDPLSKTSLMDGLKLKYSQAKEQHKEMKKENENLKRKLAGLREENATKKAEIAKLEEGGGRKRSMSRVSSDIKELEDQLVYQQQEIARLNEKINAAKATQN